MKTKVAGLTFDTKQDALDFFRSGLKTLEGKGKQPTKGGLSDPHANCTPDSGCEVALERDKSAPERRRDAQVVMSLAIQAYVEAAQEEGMERDQIEQKVADMVQDSFYLVPEA